MCWRCHKSWWPFPADREKRKEKKSRLNFKYTININVYLVFFKNAMRNNYPEPISLMDKLWQSFLVPLDRSCVEINVRWKLINIANWFSLKNTIRSAFRVRREIANDHRTFWHQRHYHYMQDANRRILNMTRLFWNICHQSSNLIETKFEFLWPKFVIKAWTSFISQLSGDLLELMLIFIVAARSFSIIFYGNNHVGFLWEI